MGWLLLGALVAALLSLAVPQDALAAVTHTTKADDFFDEVGYFEPNLDAPHPSLPCYGTGTDDVIEDDGWAWTPSRGLWRYTAGLAQDNGSEGASMCIRYPQAGWMRMGNQRTSGLLDVYVTFTALYTNADSLFGRVYWGPFQGYGRLMEDGFWVENATIYRTEYQFKDSETGADIVPAGGMSYTERSMNVGEGFMVQGATAGYVAGDLPRSILGTNADGINWSKTEGEPALANTQVTAVYLENETGWLGYVGDIPQTVRPGVRVETTPYSDRAFDLFLNGGFDTVANGGGNQYVQGADSYGVVKADIAVGGTTTSYPDASLWMGASVTAPSSSCVSVLGINLPRSCMAGHRLTEQFGSVTLTTRLFVHAETFEGTYVNAKGTFSSLDLDYGKSFGRLKTQRWYVPQFHVFTAVTPQAPSKEADKERCVLGDTITYTIRQHLNNDGIDAWPNYRYESLEFYDTLPAGLELDEDSFQVLDPNGTPVESGTLETSGSVEEGMEIHWTADEGWLLEDLPMDGRELLFVFDAQAQGEPESGAYVNTAHTVINGSDRQSNEVTTVLGQHAGGLCVHKSSSLPETTSNNPNYSLEGASYGIYDAESCEEADLIATLTTDADGCTNTVELEPTSYWVKEMGAPLGYALDETVHEALVVPGETTTMLLQDAPLLGGVRVKKVDGTSGDGLDGATFSISNATGRPVVIEGESIPDGQECLTITSGEDGIAELGCVLPFGTYVVTEKEAPEGYELNTSWNQQVDLNAENTVCDLTGSPVPNEPTPATHMPVTGQRGTRAAAAGSALVLLSSLYLLLTRTREGV